MNGSLTLLDDNLLYIAFSIIGLSGKNEQKMKFRGRGVGQRPNRSFDPNNQPGDPSASLLLTSGKAVFCKKGTKTKKQQRKKRKQKQHKAETEGKGINKDK